MMGSKLKLEILTSNATDVGATYQYSGSMMGLMIDFSETVTKYVSGREKIWRTIGNPQLLIVESYEMRVVVEPLQANTAQLTISFDYDLPRSGMWRLIGRALAGSYARWCLDSMISGTKRDLERSAP